MRVLRTTSVLATTLGVLLGGCAADDDSDTATSETSAILNRGDVGRRCPANVGLCVPPFLHFVLTAALPQSSPSKTSTIASPAAFSMRRIPHPS